jgi:phosphoenolpyruvate carboxylase
MIFFFLQTDIFRILKNLQIMSDIIISHELQKLREDFDVFKTVISSVDQKVAKLVPLKSDVNGNYGNEVVEEVSKARIVQQAYNNYEVKYCNLLPDELKGVVKSIRFYVSYLETYLTNI